MHIYTFTRIIFKNSDWYTILDALTPRVISSRILKASALDGISCIPVVRQQRTYLTVRYILTSIILHTHTFNTENYSINTKIQKFCSRWHILAMFDILNISHSCTKYISYFKCLQHCKQTSPLTNAKQQQSQYLQSSVQFLKAVLYLTDLQVVLHPKMCLLTLKIHIIIIIIILFAQ